MNFTSTNVKDLVESFLPFLKRIIKKETTDCVRTSLARIVAEGNSEGTYRVVLAENDSGDDAVPDESFEVINKYGFNLSVGDYVYLQYWNGMNNAYIVSAYDGMLNPTINPEDLGVIIDPTQKEGGQYLYYDGENWVARSVPSQPGMISFTSLWKNDSPTTNFTNTSLISVPQCANYSKFYITFALHTGDQSLHSMFVFEKNKIYAVTANRAVSSGWSGRSFTISDSGIQFNAGHNGTTTTGNGYCIPIELFGITMVDTSGLYVANKTLVIPK